ncbi:hypothetical protein PR048_014923 [Dryococelus australis]|uniref:Uncharacterized protein n=1 Tax=Dryococelus australis TaxID=614101 RepID=A0ABQ9HFP0_9NEOP|nr:hypothetical protein PR048_014923 [Dryococelus australis]
MQSPEESILAYAAALKELSKHFRGMLLAPVMQPSRIPGMKELRICGVFVVVGTITRNLSVESVVNRGHLEVVCKGMHVDFVNTQELQEVYTCKLSVEGALLEIEIDTGSFISAIPYYLYCQALYQIPLQTTSTVFLTYQGAAMKPKGVIVVTIRIKNVEHNLPLYVVRGGATALVVETR